MSKFILKKRISGFTILSNNVINALKGNLEALGFYSYLLSLPDEWEFFKTQLSKECHIGTKKVDALLRILKKHGLVKFGQIRNQKGQFEKFFLEIYDVEQVVESDSPDGNSCRTVKAAGRIGEAIKEELIQQTVFKENKNKSFCISKDQKKHKPGDNSTKHSFADSMNQMANEQRHIEEHEAVKRSPMPDGLRKLCQSLIRPST